MVLDTSGAASIIFPNLGINLGYFPSSITLFGRFSIAFYGLIIAVGMVLAVVIAMAWAKKTHQDTDDYVDLAIFIIIFGIIGARLYYVLFTLDYYLANPLEVINIRGGGLAIYGGVIGGIIAGFVVCKVKKIRFLRVFDTVAPGLVLAQAIGRWGNFFNREAFGEYTNSLFAMQIRYDEVGGVVTDLMRENMVTIDGVQYIQVAPTFLYESALCLLIFILIIIFRRFQQYNGEVALWYLGAYALGRAWIEGMRTDSLMVWNTNIAVSQLLSVGVFAGALVLLIINRIRLNRKTWVPDFEKVLSPGAPGTVEFSKERKAVKKEGKKNASNWETYTVENEEKPEEASDVEPADVSAEKPEEPAEETPVETVKETPAETVEETPAESAEEPKAEETE